MIWHTTEPKWSAWSAVVETVLVDVGGYAGGEDIGAGIAVIEAVAQIRGGDFEVDGF